jgi:hypothetical protein
MGTLLGLPNGIAMPGGTEVLFSADRQLYLAYESQDGLDGEDLTLYKFDGTIVWEGYDSG